MTDTRLPSVETRAGRTVAGSMAFENIEQLTLHLHHLVRMLHLICAMVS